MSLGALKSAFALAVEFVTDIVMDSDGTATAKGALDHELDAAVCYHFGFYSRPNDGAMGVVVKAGGKGGASFLVAFRDRQYEIALEKGEAAMVSAFNSRFHLKSNGDADLVAPGNVHLGSDAGLLPQVDGVVRGQGIDTFTGISYGLLGNVSQTVMAKP